MATFVKALRMLSPALMIDFLTELVRTHLSYPGYLAENVCGISCFKFVCFRKCELYNEVTSKNMMHGTCILSFAAFCAIATGNSLLMQKNFVFIKLRMS